MDQALLEAILLNKPGATKDYKAEWGWLRFRVGERMYAALCQPGSAHASMYAGHPLLNLKCDPLEAEGLRQLYPDILPGFYSDKRTWISIRLDGNTPQELIVHLCEASYRLVFGKLTKKVQREILQTTGLSHEDQE